MIRVNAPAAAKADAPYIRPSFVGARAARLLAWLLIIGLVWLALNGLRPSGAAPAGAPAAEFSSDRALAHVKAVAGEPRPIGSPAHARARDYIIEELKKLGLESRIQKTVALNQDRSPLLQAAGVENIIAEISGYDSREAVLFVSHYDTVPNSPGANDDGVGVAAMLEMARAVASGPRLKRSVILLFTDGEELGMLGARAFLDEHPLAKNVGVVINFEARGCAGPAVMFETGKDNRRLIREFASAAPRPVAHSFSYEIYRLLPNDTDFSVFKKAGLAGLNFAHIERPLYYHNRLDHAEQVDRGTLQHHGATALALARRLADGDPQASGEGDAAYF
ncbi:MAG TPA: M20/M25/M40 family metallo-hydrolase, partial [Blastocatellia bacterium]